MNPCPCGQGPASDRCRCTAAQVRGYWRRLSGPLLDRIDLVVNVEPVDLDELITERIHAEDSDAVRRRVIAARQAQAERWKHLSPRDGAAATNASLDQVMSVIAETPRHTYQILTKRAERMAEYFEGHKTSGS